jgi:hypothetical protein
MQENELAVPVDAPPELATFAGQLLADLAGLSLGLSLGLALVGWLLWATGWRLHRFWLVFLASSIAGVVGLLSGRALGSPLLIVGLLLAFAAGLLAVELSRLIIFVAGGLSAAWAGQSIAPAMPYHVLLFLVGGLVSLLLFRLWVMLWTSFLGASVGGLATVQLLGKLTHTNPANWVDRHPKTVYVSLAVVVLLGVIVQALLERWWLARRSATQHGRQHSKAAADDSRDEAEGAHATRQANPGSRGKHAA